jgi:hypothetical protein
MMEHLVEAFGGAHRVVGGGADSVIGSTLSRCVDGLCEDGRRDVRRS